jgi:hypothetical protein
LPVRTIGCRLIRGESPPAAGFQVVEAFDAGSWVPSSPSR